MTGGHDGAHDGAAVLRSARLLPDLLATDVQHYAPFIADIAAALAAARHGAAPPALHGNVYTLTLGKTGAHIVNGRDPSIAPETLSLDAFEAAFRHWTHPGS